MEFPVDPNTVLSAGHHFDNIVGEIQKNDFQVKNPPASNICKECDFRMYCVSQNTIKYRFVRRKKRTMKRIN